MERGNVIKHRFSLCLFVITNSLFVFTGTYAFGNDFSVSTNISLKFHVNDEFYKSYSYHELKSFLYPVTLSDSSVEKNAISLGEVLPVFVDVYKIIIHQDVNKRTSIKTIENDNLAEEIDEWYVFYNDNACGIDTGKYILKNIDQIDVYGDRLSVPSGEENIPEVWISWEGTKGLKKEIHRFEILHNVKFKVIEVPRILSKLLAVKRGGGRLPDLMMVQSDYIPALVKGGILQNLDYMVEKKNSVLDSRESEAGGIETRGIEAFSYRYNKTMHVWAVPFYYDTQVIFYNKDALAKANVEKGIYLANPTLLSLEKMGEKIRKAGIIPMAWNVYSAYWLLPFQIGFGKDIGNPDTLRIINDTSTKNAIFYLLKLKQKGLLKPMERDAMVSFFVSDRVAFILSGSYSIPMFQDIGVNFGILPFPYNKRSGRYITPLLDFKGLGVSRKSKHTILVKRLIRYLTGVGVQKRFVVKLSKLPVNRSVSRELGKHKGSDYWVLKESSKIGKPVPPSSSYKIYKNTMWKLLRFVFAGKMKVDEALTQGQNIINNQINN